MENMGFTVGGMGISFIAGLLAFLSPCVLPLVPAYLGYVSGLSIAELKAGKGGKQLLLGVISFVLGFSVVFTLMGLTASTVGVFLAKNKSIIEFLAGILLIIFGVHLIGIIRIPILDYEKRAEFHAKTANVFVSFLMGTAFAFGWTPCIGPTLSGILALAAVSDTVLQGGILLFIYSMGLGIPFILSGIFAGKIFGFIAKTRKALRFFEIVSGVLLIILGILLITGWIRYISYIIPQWELLL